MDVSIEYSENRGTWNVFVNGEWYSEHKEYEQAERVYHSFYCMDDYDDEPNGYEEY